MPKHLGFQIIVILNFCKIDAPSFCGSLWAVVWIFIQIAVAMLWIWRLPSNSKICSTNIISCAHSVGIFCFALYNRHKSCILLKVHIFWEGHFLKQFSLAFLSTGKRKYYIILTFIYSEKANKFCGPLRIYELY